MPVVQETAALAGAKRKRNAGIKFYAVRFGHEPGVYQSWDECLRQVKGFKGAIFKSFPTFTEAEKFIETGNGGSSTSSASSTHKYYAVQNGRIPGIYTNWKSAQEQITGWTKPIYKGFSTRAEAQRFHDAGKLSSDEQGKDDGGADSASADAVGSEPPVKQPRGASAADVAAHKASRVVYEDKILDGYEPGVQLPVDAEDGFDTNIILKKGTSDVIFKSDGQRNATKLRASREVTDTTVRIYTDGSSLRNGQKGAFAGVGVYFGSLDSRNISESLPGPRQTNQRAELTAIVRALDTAPKDRDVTVVTDSEYAINCATKWHLSWKNNGWKTASGNKVENKDIVENILSRIDERTALQSKTLFEWVKGHANHAGNVEADKLAVDGARQAAQLPSKAA